MSKPLVGLSLMPEPEFLAAAMPLFEQGEVEALEWSFDTAWGANPLPQWTDELLAHYSDAGRLFGHGVSYSMFSAGIPAYHRRWLEQLAAECSRYRYRHISEHFGFMVAGEFHRAAPLPLPLEESTLALGTRGIAGMQQAAGVPIGVENLAFAFCAEDVFGQGAFLDRLLRAVGGFLLLDLHNIYCQLCNFDCSAEELLGRYPLDLVREVHISGGSWSQSSRREPGGEGPRRVRRDTHDDAVPHEVFALLVLALERCANLEVVIFERLGSTLDPQSAASFHDDFRRIKEIAAADGH